MYIYIYTYSNMRKTRWHVHNAPVTSGWSCAIAQPLAFGTEKLGLGDAGIEEVPIHAE